jgi:hypothetical protein
MPDWRSYDDLNIGDTFPEQPSQYVVRSDIAAGFAAIAATARRTPGAETSSDPVPPILAAVYVRGAQNALKGPPGGIHAKQSFAFKARIEIGDELETTLTIKDKYEKKGRRYVVSHVRTTNQHGVEVTTGEIVSIWGQEQ